MRVGENAIMKTRPSICALCHRPLDGGDSNRAAPARVLRRRTVRRCLGKTSFHIPPGPPL